MKRLSIFIASVLIALTCAAQPASLAQTKKPVRRPTPAPTPVPDMRAEATQVATQIKNVSNFIYVYGKIVNSIEVADDQVKQNQTSPEIQAKNKKSKEALITSINSLRAGLENMARGFKANPRLQIQYLRVTNATDAAANVERLATAGRYDEAGKMLVTVVEKLTDTMMSMRLL